MVDDETPSLAQRLRAAGLKKSYAYMVAGNQRTPSLKMALKINAAIGVKLGPIANATDEQIAVLSEIHGDAA